MGESHELRVDVYGDCRRGLQSDGGVFFGDSYHDDEPVGIEVRMLEYDENVTIWDEDDNMVGRCRMLGWVSVSVGGAKRWKGEILPVPGQPFDFELRSIEKSGLRLQCEDGAMAKSNCP